MLEDGLADDGVLDGPSLGVLRAVKRGVSSFAFDCWICVLICAREGREDESSAAAAGS